MINVDNAIKIALKTGTMEIGSKKTINLIKKDQCKLVIVANNCPKAILKEFQTYCKFSSDIFIYQYKGSNSDLGFLCGKPFMISVISVIDPGDSDILKLKEESSNLI